MILFLNIKERVTHKHICALHVCYNSKDQLRNHILVIISLIIPLQISTRYARRCLYGLCNTWTHLVNPIKIKLGYVHTILQMTNIYNGVILRTRNLPQSMENCEIISINKHEILCALWYNCTSWNEGVHVVQPHTKKNLIDFLRICFSSSSSCIKMSILCLEAPADEHNRL